MTSNIIFIGPTGAGKSSLIENLSQGNIKDISSNELKSKTVTTEFYDFSNLGCKIADTPGLGDSQSRDQIFLDQFVDKLQQSCEGVHRLYFFIPMTTKRFDSNMNNGLKTIIDMFGGINKNIFKILLSMCDEVSKDKWEDTRKRWLIEFKDYGLDILIVGKDNLSEVVTDISKIDKKKMFIQTKFMEKVKLQQTKLKEIEDKLKKL